MAKSGFDGVHGSSSAPQLNIPVTESMSFFGMKNRPWYTVCAKGKPTSRDNGLVERTAQLFVSRLHPNILFVACNEIDRTQASKSIANRFYDQATGCTTERRTPPNIIFRMKPDGWKPEDLQTADAFATFNQGLKESFKISA